MTVQEFELLKRFEAKRHASDIGKTRLAHSLRDEIINNRHAYGFKIVGLAVLIKIYCDVKKDSVAQAINEVYKAVGTIDPRKESFVTLYYRAVGANEQLEAETKEPIALLLQEVFDHGISHFINDDVLAALPPRARTYLSKISQAAFYEAREGKDNINDELLLLWAKLDLADTQEALGFIFKGRQLSKVARNKIGCEAILFRAGIDEGWDERIQALDILADKKYKLSEALKVAKRIAFKRQDSEVKAVIQKINKLQRKKPLQ